MIRPILFLLPVLYAIFVWWFTTGLVIAVYGQSRRVIRGFFVAATVLLAGALWGIVQTRGSATLPAVYAAFACGVVVWGWQTAAYYLGFVTGPRHKPPHPHSADMRLRRRFWLAMQDSLFHELVALAFLIVLAALTLTAANPWAFIVYTALWAMHTSAKLNVFFGVRNFRIDFLPSHLHHLGPLLGTGRSNALFPFSLLFGSVAALALGYWALHPVTLPADSAGALMVATMIVLGLLEHLILVLPLPVTLWGWGVRSLTRPDGSEEIGVHYRPKKPILRTPTKQIVEG